MCVFIFQVESVESHADGRFHEGKNPKENDRGRECKTRRLRR